jgi:glycine/serine hydroxymethyltransferase
VILRILQKRSQNWLPSALPPSACLRNINFEYASNITHECGVLIMADIANIAGLVAVMSHQRPTLFCDFVAVTTHKSLRDPRNGIIICNNFLWHSGRPSDAHHHR